MPYKVIEQDALPTQYLSQIKRFPWYDATQYNRSDRKLELGSLWWQGENAFMLVQADEALTVGQLVSWTVPTADTATAGGTVTSLTLTSGGLTADAEIGNYVYIGGSSPTTIRKIIDNAAGTLTFSARDQNSPVKYGTGAALRGGALYNYDADSLSAAVTSGNAIIIRPGHVSVSTGTTGTAPPVGVALGTVTIHYYTIIQVIGLALVSADATTAIVVGVNGTPGAGGIVGGSAADGLYQGAGTLMPQVALGSSTAILPYFVNLLQNC